MEKQITAFICVFWFFFAGIAVPGVVVDASDVWRASKAARRGDAVAQYRLGNYYYYGQGGLPVDYSQAVKWYRLAADQGNVRAQLALGFCYFHGCGVHRNVWKGIRLIIMPNGDKKGDP